MVRRQRLWLMGPGWKGRLRRPPALPHARVAADMYAAEDDEFVAFHGVEDAVGEAGHERPSHGALHDGRGVGPLGR